MTARRINWFVVAIGAVGLLAALPLLVQPGLLNTRGGGDSPFLLQRLHQLEMALRDGHFPVRWMPDANYGFGYPFYNFYAPLSIYITAVFRFIGFSYVGAIEASQVAGFLVAAGGMFRLARRWWGSEWVGLVTAVAYTFAPFHMVNIYVRGDSLAEFWAMAWYPWVILAAAELWVANGGWRKQRQGVAYFALVYAALVLSHNISALIFSPFLLLYILLKWVRRNGQWAIANGQWSIANSPPPTLNLRSLIANLLPSAAALLLGLALAAWFFVPALGEQSLAQLGPVTEGYFHYSNHFRGADLVQSSLLFDYDVSGGGAFRMGLVQAATAVLGLLVLIARARGRARGESYSSPRHPITPSPLLLRSSAPLLFTTLTLLVATFMITPLARPLWDHLPLLPFTQFPWRFLSVQAFAAALAAGGLALLPGRKVIVPLLVGLLALSGLGALRTDALLLADSDVTAEKLAQYEWFTGNIGSTVSAEYLPPTVTPRPYTSLWLNAGQRHVARALDGELAGAELVEFKTGKQVWRVTAVTPITLQFSTLHWPGWAADVDGVWVAVRPSPGSGLITLDAPSGAHTITLRLTRPPLRLTAELVSLLALGLTLALLGWRQRPSWGKWALAAAGIGLLALIVRVWPQRELTATSLTWDFAQMGYLHHAPPAGISFANGAALHQYRYDRDELSPGDTLTIQIAATGLRGFFTEVALVTPAVQRWAEAAAAPVSKTGPVRQEPLFEYRLAIPPDTPPGLYVPRLRVGDSQRYAPLTPAGQARGDLFLRPVRVLGVAETAVAQNLAVELTQFAAHEGLWSARLRWATARPLAPNYNVSLRFLDEFGNLVAHYDTQPGYGFLPSSTWPPGVWMNDWLTFAFPENMPERVVLMAQLYAIGGETALYRRLGTLVGQEGVWTLEPYVRQFALPAGVVQETAVFLAGYSPLIQLHGYQHHSADNTTVITLYWEALAELPTNYTRFVHILDVAGNLLAQDDAMPQANSYPTSQWLPAEIVPDTVRLVMPPAAHRVVVGFYENLGDAWPRLTAVSRDGAPFPHDAVPLTEIEITRD